MTIIARFRQGVVIGLALAVFVYVAYAVRGGAVETAEALRAFPWTVLPPLLFLSAVNYALRALRWELYLRHLGIRVPLASSMTIFVAGLAMTITPGKVGEFLKSWLLREQHGVPAATSAPVVLAERVTDLLALVLIASFGAASYGGPAAVPVLVVAITALAAGLAVIQHRGLAEMVFTLLARLPAGAPVVAKLREAAQSARAVLGGRALVMGLFLSTVAWVAECWEYQLAFAAVGYDPGLPVALFGYAFSTVAGIVSPGGLGPTDVGLIEIARQFTPGLPADTATAAAFVTRFCTLWFAVILGALALLRFRGSVEAEVERARAAVKVQ